MNFKNLFVDVATEHYVRAYELDRYILRGIKRYGPKYVDTIDYAIHNLHKKIHTVVGNIFITLSLLFK